MKDIPTQADDLTSLAAADFNQIPDESENQIESSGQTLDGSDLFQLAKSTAIYSAVGDVFATSGSANAIVLSAFNLRKEIPPAQIVIGTRLRFRSLLYNTSTSVTLRPAGPGAVALPVNLGELPLLGTPSVPINFLKPGYWVTAIYDISGSQNYYRITQVERYELADYSVDEINIRTSAVTNAKIGTNAITNAKVNDVSLDKITAGEVDIQEDEYQFFMRTNEPRLSLSDPFTLSGSGSSITLTCGNGSSPNIDGLDYIFSSAGTNIRRVQIGTFGTKISDMLVSHTFQLETIVTDTGVTYSDGPGNNVSNHRRASFGYSTTWGNPVGHDTFFWTPLTSLTLTGIPYGVPIKSATLTWFDGGVNHSSDLSYKVVDVAGVATLDNIVTTSVTQPLSGQVEISYDATLLNSLP